MSHNLSTSGHTLFIVGSRPSVAPTYWKLTLQDQPIAAYLPISLDFYLQHRKVAKRSNVYFSYGMHHACLSIILSVSVCLYVCLCCTLMFVPLLATRNGWIKMNIYGVIRSVRMGKWKTATLWLPERSVSERRRREATEARRRRGRGSSTEGARTFNAARGLESAVSSPSGSGRSPTTKRHLVHL